MATTTCTYASAKAIDDDGPVVRLAAVSQLGWEALLEAGLTSRALAECGIEVQVLDGLVSVEATDASRGEAGALCDVALRVVAARDGARSGHGTRGVDTFVDLGFNRLASAALHHGFDPSIHRVHVAKEHLLAHFAAAAVEDCAAPDAVAMPPALVEGGFMSAQERERERHAASAMVEGLMEAGLGLGATAPWRAALRDPARHWALLGNGNDVWHEAVAAVQYGAARRGWSECTGAEQFRRLGFTGWAATLLDAWTIRSASGHMSAVDAALLHIDLCLVSTDGPLSGVDCGAEAGPGAMPAVGAADPREHLAGHHHGLLAEELAAQAPHREGCTLYFHGTTSRAAARMQDAGVRAAVGHGGLDYNCRPNGVYLTTELRHAAEWACAKTQLMATHMIAPDSGVRPSVVVFQVEDAAVTRLHCLRYGLEAPFHCVAPNAEDVPATASELVRRCRLGERMWAAVDENVHWIEGPRLLNARDPAASWTFGGHQVCVKRAQLRGRSRCDGIDLLDASLVGKLSVFPGGHAA